MYYLDFFKPAAGDLDDGQPSATIPRNTEAMFSLGK